jgi:hypothetical protein
MRAVPSRTSLTASGFGRLDAGCEHASGEGRRLIGMRIVDALESGSDGGKWVRNAHGLEANGDKWEGTGTEDSQRKAQPCREHDHLPCSQAHPDSHVTYA